MITQAELHEAFNYDPATGVFSRKKVFSNRSKVGGKLGLKQAKRHITIYQNGKYYCAHRLAWLYVYGKWPDGYVDHINGDPTDNRISNLRDSTQSQNLCNSKLPVTNKTGVKGVSWDDSRGQWFAKIQYKKKQYPLGRYDDFDVACQVVMQKRLEIHGSFARFL
jgi:hypothetical protein